MHIVPKSDPYLLGVDHAGATAAGALATRPRLLLVDSDQEARDRVAEQLRSRFDLDLAGSGEEALALVSAGPAPNVVLIDPRLSDGNGLTLLYDLKLRLGKTVPMLIMTEPLAHGLPAAIAEAGDELLLKPVARWLLDQRLSRALRTHAALLAAARESEQAARGRAQTQREHELAQRVVKSLLSRGCMGAPFIRAHLSPVSLFNGDFAVAARTREGGVRVMLGDFAGHGLSAAIGALPVADIFYGATANGAPMDAVLRQVNAKLRAILPTEMFCAAAVLELDLVHRRWLVWNGGLPDLVLRRPSLALAYLPSRHLPLGILDERRFDPALEAVAFTPNDSLFCFTDGLTELGNSFGEQFGLARVRQHLAAGVDSEGLLDELRLFRGGSQAVDDMSLVEILAVPWALDLGDLALPEPAMSEGRHVRMTLDFGVDALARCEDVVATAHRTLTALPGLHAHDGELFTILAELLNNGLEHGVLGLDACLKDDADGFHSYYERRAQALQQLTSGWIRLEIVLRQGRQTMLTLRVSDSGGGTVREPAATPGLRGHGRGLALLRALCDELRLLGGGKGVEVTKRFGS